MKFPHRNLSIPDVHLGHDTTSAEDILKRLTAMLTPEFLNGTDILYFPGDLFDKAILFSNENIPSVLTYISSILQICAKLNIKVRLLEGTPYHDAKQGRNLIPLVNAHYPELDFKYIDDMIIEYIEDFDIHVMYVPDEWASREEMYLKARSLLAEHNLEQVDFIIGHNQFYYQYPDYLQSRVNALVEKDWNDMVRYTAYFGHIHRRSTCGKIEFAGSFDRLAHGEEFDKGFLEGNYYSEQEWKIDFHVNKDAQVYQTIDLPKKDETVVDDEQYMEVCLRHIHTIRKLPPHSCIRFRYHDASFQIRLFIKQVQKWYPQFHYTYILKDETDHQDKKRISLKQEQNHYQAINITRDNIVRLFKEHAGEQATDNVVELLERYIKQI